MTRGNPSVPTETPMSDDLLSIEEALELNPRGDEIDRYLDGDSMEDIINDREDE